MTTRRTALLAALGSRTTPAATPQPKAAPNFTVPAHACDCHTHIFGDFPLSPARSYTPEPALPADMKALHKALHIERVVIVTPSVYGTDNAATLFGLKQRGKTARGIAVIDERTSDKELAAMHRAGMRGIRLNLSNGPRSTQSPRERLQAAMLRMKPLGWHVQMLGTPATVASVKDLVQQTPVPVVFDHFGGADLSKGLDQPGFTDLVDLVRSGHAYVKISIPAVNMNRFAGAQTLAEALIKANVDRILWGTDWPHPIPAPGRKATEVSPFAPIDDGEVMNQLALWAPDAATRHKILVANPARLYGF
jgi:predicted TIM-barrel fold metal-dependent hydrolase